MELVGFMSRSSTTGLPGQAPGFDQSSRSFLESSFPLVEDEYDFEMLKTSSENTKVETSKKNDEVFFNETTTYNVDSPSYIKLEIVKNDRNLRANACKTNSTLHEQFSFDRTFAHPSSSQPPEQLPASPSSPISQLATPKRYCSTELDDLITRSAYLLGHKPQYDHPLRNSSDDLKNMIPSTNIQNLSSCQTSFEDAVKYKDGLSHSNLTTSLAPFSSATFNTTKYPSIPLSFSSNQLPSPFHTSINKIFPPHSDSVEDIFFQTTKNVIYDISRELLSLEVTYTQKLRNAVQVFTSFVDEYADCNDDGREDIKESVGLAEGFLRLLTPLMQCHDDWLPTLKHRLLDWSFCKEEEMQLGDLFARNIPMFRIYELYFNQYDTLMDDVMKHYLNVEDGSFSHLHDTPTSNHQKDQTDVKKMKQNANYVDVLKVVEGSPKCVQLVSCLLLQPYHHLSMLASVIERLKEQCQSSSLDADNLQESSKVISGILKVFERKQSHMENRQQLCEVVQDIKGLGFLMRHQPELVREGCMQLISRTGCQQRLILLFDSCLVVARKEMSVERHFKFTACIPITNIKLVSSKQNQDFNNNNHSHHLKLAITLDHNQVPSSPFADQYFQGALASSLDDKYTYQLNLGSLSFEERSRWHDDLSRVISQARQNSQVTDLKFFVEFFDKMAPLAKDSKRHNDVTSGNQSSRPALVCWHRSCSIGRRDRLSALKNTYSGFVCRQFKGTSTWQSLWVVLCQRCLYFYKSHKDDQPLTCLPLSGYSISCCGKENVGEEFVFEVTYKNHAYLFKCHSEYSFKRWVQVIKSTIETLHPINFP